MIIGSRFSALGLGFDKGLLAGPKFQDHILELPHTDAGSFFAQRSVRARGALEHIGLVVL